MKPANAPSPFSDRIFLVRGVIYPLSLDIRPRNQRIVLRDFFRLFEKLKKFPCWKRSVVSSIRGTWTVVATKRTKREVLHGFNTGFAGRQDIRFVTEAISSRMTTPRNYYFGNSFPDAWSLRKLEVAKDCSLGRGRERAIGSNGWQRDRTHGSSPINTT